MLEHQHDQQELKADAEANADDNLYDFDVQCAECETWISAKETDDRDYCRDCQNPEYDPVWPMGD
jgi:formamidopyrimidine-DNA glycosylase